MSDRISLTREQYLDSIRQLTASATAMADRLNMTQMTWQPLSGEGWSISECLDHIAISTRVYLDAMEAATGNATAGGNAAVFQTAGLPSTKFARDLEPPLTRKVPAPGKVRPRATLNPEGILPEFLKTMDRVSALVASTSARDLNTVRFRNPLFPVIRFTVSTGFLIVAAHGRRHLWQADQVTKQPDFPSA